MDQGQCLCTIETQQERTLREFAEKCWRQDHFADVELPSQQHLQYHRCHTNERALRWWSASGTPSSSRVGQFMPAIHSRCVGCAVLCWVFGNGLAPPVCGVCCGNGLALFLPHRSGTLTTRSSPSHASAMGFQGLRAYGFDELWDMYVPKEYQDSVIFAGQMWLMVWWTVGVGLLVHKMFFDTSPPRTKKTGWDKPKKRRPKAQ